MWERACSRRRRVSQPLIDCHTAFASKLAPTVLIRLRLVLPATWPALLVVSADRNRLQWRLDQAQCNTEVVEPVLNFLFHGLPPLRVMLAGANSVALSYSDSSPKSYVMLERNHNELLLN